MTNNTPSTPAQVEAAAQALATAEADQRSARELADSLRARLRGGDFDVTAAQLVEADAGIERASLLIAGARLRHAALLRALPYAGETTLADSLAAALQSATGCVVQVARSIPDKLPSVRTAPVFVVVQDAPSEHGKWTAAVNGTVRVLHVRNRFHAPFDFADFAEGERWGEHQCRFERGPQVTEATNDDGVTVTTWTVNVLRAFAELPTLPASLSSYSDFVGPFLLAAQRRALGAVGDIIETREARELAQDNPDASGRVVSTLRTVVKITARERDIEPGSNPFTAAVEAGVAAMPGKASDLGRCLSVRSLGVVEGSAYTSASWSSPGERVRSFRIEATFEALAPVDDVDEMMDDDEL